MMKRKKMYATIPHGTRTPEINRDGIGLFFSKTKALESGWGEWDGMIVPVYVTIERVKKEKGE